MTHLIALARQGVAGLAVLVALTVVLGLAYPLAVTGAAALLGDRADRQLLRVDGEVVGSRQIGQTFDGEGWFRSRPSAAGDGYDAMASGASNLGPNNEDLLALVEERRVAVAEAEGVDPQAVPPDALTASASGLDPDISPRYALLQVERVARERDLPAQQVRSLVEERVLGRTLGFLGEPRVNVLELNLALDALARGSGG
jgi:K+-transporting ATPase ATPase C chain